MANFIRRIVSGNKARFKDHELGLELDLVYITDHLIIMGFPASGLESIYRNPRDAAKRFLDHRHGQNYWIFNFCPVRENEYASEEFGGRVTRFPFPDHHAPPLAILPLAVREIGAWLSGSEDRVAVLHCKAGKGRSGTIACAYLLSLPSMPSSPKLERNHSGYRAFSKSNPNSRTPSERAAERAEKVIDDVRTSTDGEEVVRLTLNGEPIPATGSPDSVSPASGLAGIPILPKPLYMEKLEAVLALHTSQRMKTTKSNPASPSPSSSTLTLPDQETPVRSDKTDLMEKARKMRPAGSQGTKQYQGVSIPSQRRYLFYWSLLLAGEGGWIRSLWDLDSTLIQHPIVSTRRPKILLKSITVRIRPLSGIKANILHMANKVIERTGAANKNAPPRVFPNIDRDSNSESPKKNKEETEHLWVSIARYDDALVSALERREKATRAEPEDVDGRVNLAVRRKCADKAKFGDQSGGKEVENPADDPSDLFQGSKWDKAKMIRHFTKMGIMDRERDVFRSKEEKNPQSEGSLFTYTLRPLSESNWQLVHQNIQSKADAGTSAPHNLNARCVSTGSSHTDLEESFEQLDNEGEDDEAVSGDDQYEDEKGVLLDAGREVRCKLYHGLVFMGWFWFIPAFHMPPPPSPQGTSSSPTTTHFKLTKKEVDFAIGAGSTIVDVDVEMEWAVPSSPPDAREATSDQRNANTGKSEPEVKSPEPDVTENNHPQAQKQTSGDSVGGGNPSFVAGLSALVTGARLRDAKEVEEAGKQ